MEWFASHDLDEEDEDTAGTDATERPLEFGLY